MPRLKTVYLWTCVHERHEYGKLITCTARSAKYFKNYEDAQKASVKHKHNEIIVIRKYNK